MQVVKLHKSIDELVEHLSQAVKNINWSYWRQNFVAFQEYSSCWDKAIYKIYSRDGLVLVVTYDNGEFDWYIESMINCYCE
ncbi:MAG: hypothetical protein QXJ97_11530 [Desulfurococcaceae archaeon]